jgi:hypothetical protein
MFIKVIEGTSITTSGVLSVTGLSIDTTGKFNEATAYFTTAIESALQDQRVLPDGAVVTIIGFNGGTGPIEYEITISADSDAEASQAVSQINTSLSQPSTQTLIKNIAMTESTGGTLSLTNLAVNSNTAGTSTESTVSKVTSAGQLITSVSTAGLTSAQVDEVATIFEDSITEELNAQGVLPAGSYVTVTGIDSNGIVSYSITMYQDPATDSSSIVSSIDSTLSQSSSRFAIQNTAIAASSGSSITLSVTSALSSLSVSAFTAGETSGLANSGSVVNALSTLSVTGFTPGITTGIPDNQWYPQFEADKQGCSNNGK